MTKSAHNIISAFNADREPERLARKYTAMRTNAFVFLRGTAHLFFQRLDETDKMPKSPIAVCCGDLHLENFGTYLADNGLTYFDVNDFDEAALAPCAVDILRFATSILVAGPVIGLKRAAAVELAKSAIEAYLSELAHGKARWIERRTSDGLIGALMGGLKRRNTNKFLSKRTVIKNGERRLNIDGERALAITTAERKALKAFVSDVGVAKHDEAGFVFLDAARRVAGTGSLGIQRYVILVEGAASEDDNLLLDLKAAHPSALSEFTRTRQPKWPDDAARTVELQSRAQAVAPKLLQRVVFDGKPFVFKEMQPSADRLSIENAIQDPEAFRRSISSMGELSAWGQLRSSGRDGTENADALIAYGADKSQSKVLLDLARACEVQVLADFADYAKAFDKGTFNAA
jgi:uncharacterized protein (DUF2252 family)